MELTKNAGPKEKWKRFFSEYSVIVITVVAIICASIASPMFMTLPNWMNILRGNSVLGILALGMTFVIIAGEIDLSVGSALVAVGAITLAVLNATGSVIVALITAVAVGAGFGAAAGVMITRGRIPSFIVTLGLMNIYRSVSMYFMSGGGFSGDVTEFQYISNTDIGGVVPMPVIYLAVAAAIFFYISKYTKFGRYVYAVGSNTKATRLSGINAHKVKILTFMLMGIAVACASIIECSRMNSINAASSGTSYELNAIAMAVVGGSSMAGGRGTILGTVFGILIIAIINNILNLVGVDPFLINAVRGAIIIIAVFFQSKDKGDQG